MALGKEGDVVFAEVVVVVVVVVVGEDEDANNNKETAGSGSYKVTVLFCVHDNSLE